MGRVWDLRNDGKGLLCDKVQSQGEEAGLGPLGGRKGRDRWEGVGPGVGE